MKISELQARQGKVDIEVNVVEKSEPRQFNKFGQPGKVCNAKVTDDSGQITLTLWNDQVDLVNVGDTVKITNGYVGEWQGELQLSTGKFGSLEVLKAENSSETKKPVSPANDSKPPAAEEESEDNPYVDEAPYEEEE